MRRNRKVWPITHQFIHLLIHEIHWLTKLLITTPLLTHQWVLFIQHTPQMNGALPQTQDWTTEWCFQWLLLHFKFIHSALPHHGTKLCFRKTTYTSLHPFQVSVSPSAKPACWTKQSPKDSVIPGLRLGAYARLGITHTDLLWGKVQRGEGPCPKAHHTSRLLSLLSKLWIGELSPTMCPFSACWWVEWTEATVSWQAAGRSLTWEIPYPLPHLSWLFWKASHPTLFSPPRAVQSV